jgi:hypothetical protein
MTPSQRGKILWAMVLVIGLLATWACVRGCGNPGEGTASISPEVRARYAKAPAFSAADSGKTAPERPGIMSRLRKGATAK